MKKLANLVFIILLAACNNGKDKTDTTDSLQTVRKIIAEDSSVIFNPTNLAWISNRYDVNHEENWKEPEMPFVHFGANQDFYNDYKSVLYWSPDSSHVLDIGSYGSVIVKDKTGHITLEAGEPDTEIALINPVKKERTRLMFVGPSSEVLSAKWVDKTDAMIVGTFDKTGNGQKDTLIWMIRVDDMFFRLYNIKSE
ncbi:MAG: hypothetical protein JWQ96_817 [Segetibacter sp.]|nr:hypothetical protein [Segetibacter sp.]